MENRIGAKMREIREECNLTKLQAAEKAKVSKTGIIYWEAGKRMPGIEYCIRLADAYDCSLDELVGRERKNDFEQNNIKSFKE